MEFLVVSTNQGHELSGGLATCNWHLVGTKSVKHDFGPRLRGPDEDAEIICTGMNYRKCLYICCEDSDRSTCVSVNRS